MNKEERKQYYITNKHKWLDYNKKSRELNKDKLKERRAKYYIKNKSVLLSKSKIHFLNNRELHLLQGYKRIDRNKNLIYDLTVEWMKENITSKSCTYCGETEDLGCDRIDNLKGHTKDNVVPCCKTCNYVRNNLFSNEEMKLLGLVIRQIKERRKQNEGS